MKNIKINVLLFFLSMIPASDLLAESVSLECPSIINASQSIDENEVREQWSINNTKGLHKFSAATFRVKVDAPALYVKYADPTYTTAGIRPDEEREDKGNITEMYDLSDVSNHTSPVYLYCSYAGTSVTLSKAVTPMYKNCVKTYQEEKGSIKNTKIVCSK
jgi:hypothetical protein